MGILLSERDGRIFDMLDTLKASTTMQIARGCFVSDNDKCKVKGEALDFVARRRLKQLFDAGYVKRVRSDILAQYVYYTEKKPIRFPHWLKIADFYLALKSTGVKIIDFQVEKKIGECIPDAMYRIERMVTQDEGRNVRPGIYQLAGFVEVHRSNNPFNYGKYEKLYNDAAAWQEEFKEFKDFPRVVIIEGKPAVVKTSKIPIQYVKLRDNLSNIREILKIT
jgi:hypothetical protein